MKLLTFLKFPVSKYSPTTGTIKALFPLVDSFFFYFHKVGDSFQDLPGARFMDLKLHIIISSKWFTNKCGYVK